jgi:hypothetical protein
MRRLALLLLGGLAVLAALTFLNVARLEVNATLPPVSKNLNLSVYPLASARWAASDIYNVTYYRVKFVPGWPELYTVGYFVPRDPGWSARLEAVGRSGTGQYAIALGGQVQITESQNAGPPVPIAGATPLDWRILATQRFSILARAWFSQGGTTAVQLVNFTAEPMSKLYQQTFYCGVSQLYDGFSGYCSTYTTGFDDVTLKFATSGSSRAYLTKDRTVHTVAEKGYAAAFLNLSSWIGGLPATGSFSIQYYLKTALSTSKKSDIQINFFIDTNGDGKPDVEYIYYISAASGTIPPCLSSAFYGYSINCTSVLYSSQSPPTNQWLTWTIPKIYDYGVVVGVAFGAYHEDRSVDVHWDNLVVTYCPLPSNVQTYTRGQQYTQVYRDPNTSPTSPPSLATEVDAYGESGNPVADWGAAIAIYQLPSPVPAYGTAVSAWGRYVRNATDVQNNVAYLSIGVDTDGDGQVDKEYIIYRYDVSSSYSGAIVSAFFRSGGNPVYVCTVSTTGACTTTDPRFVVVNAGSMATGNNYQWSYTLYEQGAIVAVAFTAVDASYYASGTADDFWVYWDDLTIEYSACPPPAGWSVAGSYVWQSNNYLLVSGSATAYMPLIVAPTRALTYVANFSGVGTYAVFDSSLGVIFGVSASGSSFTALCGGGSTPLGSLPAARYVELRPLNGLGDIIIRDQYGAILARYGCRYTTTPQYVGFRGGLLRVYNVTALG